MRDGKEVISTPAVVSVPAGTHHCPLIFKRVGKPFAWMEIMLTDKYSRRELGKQPSYITE